MSEQPDVDPGQLPQAPAAVDILPAAGGRKGHQQEAPPAPPVDPAWAAPAGAVNPWTGATDPSQPQPAPAEPVQAPSFEQPAVAPEPTVQQPVAEQPAAPLHAGAIPPSVNVPVFPGAQVPVTVPFEEAPSNKRFLGMQLRRSRKGEDAQAAAEEVPAGPQAPVAAWPTDVGLQAVAEAEPAEAGPWGPPTEATWSQPAAADVVPQEAPADPAPTWDAPVGEAPVAEAPVADAPVADAPVADAPVADAPAAEAPVVEAPVVEAPLADPVAVAPFAPAALVPAAEDEARSLRTQLESSEAQRTAAEQRADHAVAYAQQLQAELTRVQSDLEAKLQATEARVRTAANEAQDWQIRHREAQTQITELAASVAGAEQRVSELRTERDELMSQLEDATSPVRDAVAQEVES